jgi:hypothetical protein
MHLLGRFFTLGATPLALFVLLIFEIGSYFLLWLAWTTIFYIMLPTIVGITGTQCAQLLIEMGLTNCLPRLASKSSRPDLSLPIS